MKIFLATCDQKLNGTTDDHLLRAQLVQNGIEVEFRSWTDASVPWGEAQLVLIRSTWDYHRRLPEFLDWTKRVSKETHLRNPQELISWNASKRYLLELEAKGLPIVPSIFSNNEKTALNTLREMLKDHFELILKPAVSATSDLTFRLKDLDQADHLVKSVLARGEALVQPFISSISQSGSLSLVAW